MNKIPTRPELDGRYFATMDGQILNKDGRPVKPFIADNGYLRVKLHIGNNRYRNYTLHVLIAETFIPNPNNLPQVNHKDTNKLNPSANNLEWCTQSYNIKHAINNKLYTKQSDNQIKASTASANKYSIAIEQIGDDGTIINTFRNKHDAARALNVMPNNIKRAIKANGKCGGYRWRKVGGSNE